MSTTDQYQGVEATQTLVLAMNDVHLIQPDGKNLVSWTLGSLDDATKPVLIDADDPQRALSKDAARTMVASLTGAFTPGSTVCMHLINDITYPVITLAILASGATWTGTNPAYKVMEMEHHFRTSLAKYVITAEDHLEVVSNAVEASGMAIEIILFDDLLRPHDARATYHPRTLRRLGDLVRHVTLDSFTKAVAEVSSTSMAALMQTSGTTGNPKLAVRTHGAMMRELDAIQDNDEAKPYEVRRLFCTPMFHAFSSPLMLFDSLHHGRATYYMKRFDSSFAQKVHDFKITETFGAPPMLQTLAQQTEHHHLLQSLRMVGYGGAVLVPETRHKFLTIFKTPIRVMPVYGMTEGGWFTMLKFPEICNEGSVGRPVPGMEFSLGPAANDSQESQDGFLKAELLVRGPHLMQGYLGNPSASAEAFRGEWLRTGDLGYIKDGKVFIFDRLKDLIKTNGWQVSPAEVENALLRSPDVADCAVFGYGTGDEEHPVACIIASRSGVTSEAIKAHLNRSLASYKVRRCEVKFVTKIPKSAAGKILRTELRALMG